MAVLCLPPGSATQSCPSPSPCLFQRKCPSWCAATVCSATLPAHSPPPQRTAHSLQHLPRPGLPHHTCCTATASVPKGASGPPVSTAQPGQRWPLRTRTGQPPTSRPNPHGVGNTSRKEKDAGMLTVGKTKQHLLLFLKKPLSPVRSSRHDHLLRGAATPSPAPPGSSRFPSFWGLRQSVLVD